jgi:flagellar motility protein MotE (MotC chaperone)
MKKTLLSGIVLLFMLANMPAKAVDMQAVKHTNPLPNFMIVLKKHGDMLALSADQKQTLKKWGKEHKPIAKKLVKAIMKGEKQLHQATLDGASKEEIMAELDKLLKARRELAALKTDCRDNLRKVLSDEQWNQVVELYTEMP